MRANIFALELIIRGRILPISIGAHRAIALVTVDQKLSRADAKVYRAKLAKLQAGSKRTARPNRIDESRGVLLSKPEMASLRLAVKIANSQRAGENLDANELLQIARSWRDKHASLTDVIEGKVIPQRDSYHGVLTFRRLPSETPTAAPLALRRKARKAK